MNELISVIVPVYNVEEYLQECFEAISNQTYKNIEIILVDDGSTDGSGKLCDSIAENNERVKVIHKSNGGLSSARNTGISTALGELISFIDSDDFPRKNMIENLHKCMKENNADVVCCDFSSSETVEKCGNEVNVFTSEEAISRLLDDYGYKCYAWNKLYKKELFEKIRYPEGEFFEDIKTTFKIFKNAKIICYLHSDLYFYRTRQDSITNRVYSVKNIDLINAIDYVKENAVKTLDKEQCSRLMAGYATYYMSFIKKAFFSDKEQKENVVALRRFIIKNMHEIMNSKGLITKVKIEMFLYAISPAFFKKLLKMKNKE